MPIKKHNNTLIVVNEKSQSLETIYNAARHSMMINSRYFVILYIMPTLSFHYWNIIRKSAEESSQNQIKNMLNNIKHQVKHETAVNVKTALELGNPVEILKNKINHYKVGWLWLPMDLGKDYTSEIIASLRNVAQQSARDLHAIIDFNKETDKN